MKQKVNVQQETFDFKAEPKTIKPKSKYREVEQSIDNDDSSSFHLNLMCDPRVVRGNTYGVISTVQRNVDPLLLKNAQKQKQQNQKKIVQIETVTNIVEQNQGVSTPPAVKGRMHSFVQTEEYVEILTDKLPEDERETQTDFYIDRPMDRLFFPKKHGVDKETQITNNDPDLFNFAEECEPLIQVLNQKVLFQARMEVLEEEEIMLMKKQQRNFQMKVYAEQSEMQRLEAIEKRKKEELERRKLQYAKNNVQQTQAHKKLISRNISKDFLESLKQNQFEILESQGFLRRPLETSLYNHFLPWLFNEVALSQQKNQLSKQCLETIIGDAIQTSQKQHSDSIQSRIDMFENKRLQIENAKQKKIQDKLDAQKAADDLIRKENLNRAINVFMRQQDENILILLQKNFNAVDCSEQDKELLNTFKSALIEAITKNIEETNQSLIEFLKEYNPTELLRQRVEEWCANNDLVLDDLQNQSLSFILDDISRSINQTE